MIITIIVIVFVIVIIVVVIVVVGVVVGVIVVIILDHIRKKSSNWSVGYQFIRIEKMDENQ